MGEKNDAICNYLAAPEIFADFINGAIFKGQKEVCAESLKEKSPVLYDFGNQKEDKRAGNRSRDVVKYLAGEQEYLIIGIENQNQFHHAMPLRCMEYDVMEYRRQERLIAKENWNEKKYEDSAAYLSGLRLEDKLCPVITLVFYHGKGTYNSCKTLHEMIELKSVNMKYMPFIQDYKMNLISIDELDEDCFETGLRELIGTMKNSGNKIELQNYIEKNKERMSHLGETTFDTIGIMINHKNLHKYKDKCQVKEGGVDMCQAILEMIEDGKVEGMEIGKAEGRKAGREEVVMIMFEKGYTCLQISEMTDISLEKIEEWTK